MNLSPQHIRGALIQIAERKGRPHYTAIVVREVLESFRTGTYHPLKAEVTSEQITLVAVQGFSDYRLNMLLEFCARNGINKILAEESGLHITTIRSFLNLSRGLTDDAWLKLSGAFKSTENAFLKMKQTAANRGSFKKDLCGTINKYRCGCRCEECKAAKASQNKSVRQGGSDLQHVKQLRNITEKYCGAKS